MQTQHLRVNRMKISSRARQHPIESKRAPSWRTDDIDMSSPWMRLVPTASPGTVCRPFHSMPCCTVLYGGRAVP